MTENNEDEFDKELSNKIEQNLKVPSAKVQVHGKKDGDELEQALIHASKHQNGRGGALDIEYSLNNGKFLILIETKNDNGNMCNGDRKSPDMDVNSTVNYAVNGAIWYAQQIYKADHSYDKIFALGVTGTAKHYNVTPYFVNKGRYQLTPDVTSLNKFCDKNIGEYYRVGILGQQSTKELTREQVQNQADKLSNDIRHIASMNNDDKAPLVASILLAMFYCDENGDNLLEELNGDPGKKHNDGQVILGYVEELLDNRVQQNTMYQDEEDTVLRAFSFLKDPSLYSLRKNGHSALWAFTSDLSEDFGIIKDGADEDALGDFYSQFVKYGNNDGKSLGIVLTPSRITKLMAKMINVNSDDYIMDPVCGSATFLVSSMNRMLKDASNTDKKKEIKKDHLIGIELNPHIYSIAISNMILRGDGNSNIVHGNFFKYGLALKNRNGQSKETVSPTITNNQVQKDIISSHPITKVLMNPPYSQGKKHPGSAEIYFIKHALEMLHEGGELSAIVPISVVVSGGKGVKKNEFIEWKKWILKHCQVLSIITMNPNIFYPAGTQTVIINIKKARAGQNGNNVNLINYADDGFHLVAKHGMQPDGTQDDKENRLMAELKNGGHNQYVQSVQFKIPEKSAYSIPRTYKNGNVKKYRTGKRKGKIEYKSKKHLIDTCWLFNAHYTIPYHPKDSSFEKTMDDFMTFKTNMQLHNHNDLFKKDNQND